MDPSLKLRMTGLRVSTLNIFSEDISPTTYLSLRGSGTSEAIPRSQKSFNQGIASSFATLPPRNDSFIPFIDHTGSK